MSLTFLPPICLAFFSLFSESNPNYCDLASRHMNAFSKEVRQTKGLKGLGSGGGMMFDLYCINLYYEMELKPDISAARRILIDCTQSFLRRINADQKIRPNLHDYPFTSKNIVLGIRFIDQFGAEVEENHICYAYVMDGEIIYDIFNQKNGTYKEIFEEPYEEALRIVLEEQQIKLISSE